MLSNQAKIALTTFVLILACDCGPTPEQARARLEDGGSTFDDAGIGRAVLSADTKLLELFITAAGSNAISGITLVGAILAAGSEHGDLATILGFIAIVLATINVVGGFLVTNRMLAMFKRKPDRS